MTQARGANPDEPDATLVEALLCEREGKQDEARAAYIKAADAGSTNAYCLYRAAVLNWPRPDHDTLLLMEQRLARATTLNSSFADAFAALAEVRALLKQPAPSVMPLVVKAIWLDPSNAWHRMTEARVLFDYNAIDEARKAAQNALALADTDEERQAAQQLLAQLSR